MERASVNVEYVLKELERLKVEIQRLEAMLMPVQKDDGISEEEIKEILREARNPNPGDWVDADELDEEE